MGSYAATVSVGVLALLVILAPSTAAAPSGAPAPAADGTVALHRPPVGAGTPSVRAAGSDRVADACVRSPLEFGRRRYVEQRGDVARVVLLVDDSLAGSSISLRVAADGASYEAHADVVEGDGDGRVTLLVDTGDTPRVTATAPGDEVTDRSGTRRDGPLLTGVYDVSVLGRGCAQSDAQLVVEPDRRVSVTAYRGNRSAVADLASPAAVREALAVGDLRKADGFDAPLDREGTRVLRGETLALALEAPGLADDVGTGAGNATSAFRGLLDRHLTVEFVESSLDGEREPERYDLGDFGDWRVLPDAVNDTYYLLVDTRAPLTPGDDLADYGRVGERYVVTVETEGATGTTAFEFAEPDVALDGFGPASDLVLSATADATVAGTTDLPNGSTLSVGLRTSGGDPVTREVTVAGGRFAAGFDLSGVAHGTPVQVVVRHGGVRVANRSGRVRGAATVRMSASVARVAQDGDRVTVDRVALSDGGFVVVHDGYFGGPVVGTSAYLPPGNHTDVAVRVDEAPDGTMLAAVAHRDADGNRRFDAGTDPRYAGGSPKDAVELADEASATPTRAAPVSPGTPTKPTGDGIPAPGPVAALAGVVVAALAARRSRQGGRR